MRVGPRLAVTATNLTSNIVEVPPAAYSSITAYAAGDQVSEFGGPSNTTATVYESLAAGNTGHTPSTSPAFWQSVGTAYLAFNSGTNYAKAAIVSDFTNHRLYESAEAGNVGHALSDPSWWLDRGPTNRFRAFDGKPGTLATRPFEMVNTVAVSGRMNTINLQNVNAAGGNITIQLGADEVYNQNFSLVSKEGVVDWTTYLFAPIERESSYVVTGLPNVPSPDVTVRLNDASIVSAGEIIVSNTTSLGETLISPEIGFQDFSEFVEDGFGGLDIVERGSRDLARYTVRVPANRASFVIRFLKNLRATPVLVIGSEIYTATQHYGLIKNARLVIDQPTYSLLTFDVDGFN